MKIDKNNFRVYYDLVNKFINAVDTNDIETLKGEFGLINEVVEELNEELNHYYDVRPKISILPFDEAFTEVKNEQKNFDFFKFDDVECWGVDCNILTDGKIDEPVFHFRICNENNNHSLQYLYIGS